MPIMPLHIEPISSPDTPFETGTPRDTSFFPSSDTKDTSHSDDGGNIVELNFEETSVLSDPEAFNRALERKQRGLRGIEAIELISSPDTPGLVGEGPDSARLHTIAISQTCFKVGRITVPPGLVLAVNGFTGVSGHSLANPHPEWADAKRTMSKPFGGSPKKLRELMTGGWKNIPESERWWDKSLGESVEAQRVKNLSAIECLRTGLEQARTL